MKNKKENIAKKFAEELQLPENALHNTFNIEFHSNTEVVIDGCMGIVEYSEELISVNLGNIVACFHGDKMEISSFFEAQTVIKGTVISMDFST